MTIHLKTPDLTELKPRIAVIGVGGAGGNAINNMIDTGLNGVRFIAANTDAQALMHSEADTRIQLGVDMTEGLGAGSKPEIGAAAAEESIEEIKSHLRGLHMAFITAGMGGGTGTGAAPVIAQAAREEGVLTVGVVTKPFHFEGQRRMRAAEFGIQLLAEQVDTLIVIPNQNLFRVAVIKTTFSEAFAMADQVLHDGISCITDVMVKEGIINLDFADVNLIMRGMGNAMMGTGQASGENRGREAAELAISNPLLDDVSLLGARGLLVSIIGGQDDLTLYEVDEAANRVREEIAHDANIIVGTAFDESLNGEVRVSVVATGLEPGLARVERPTAEPKAKAQSQPQSQTQSPRQETLGERLDNVAANHGRQPAVDPAMPQQQADSGASSSARVNTGPEGGARPRGVETPYGAHSPQAGPSGRLHTGQRIPEPEEFPRVAQAVWRQHHEENRSESVPKRSGALGMLDRLVEFAGFADYPKSRNEPDIPVATQQHSSTHSPAKDPEITPEMFDPHAKGAALSGDSSAFADDRIDIEEEIEIPRFFKNQRYR
jgi:cell division protein FtsZ